MARDDYQWELARRTKLVAEIQRTKAAVGRDVKIVVPGVAEHKLDNLTAGVQAPPGNSGLSFTWHEGLLQRLFELSQAIANDYQRLKGDL